jgi:hypothetical protein
MQRRVSGYCSIPPTQETVARHYVFLAQQYFREDELAQSQTYLSDAFAIHNFGLKEVEYILESLASIAFQKWCSTRDRKVHWSSTKKYAADLIELLKNISSIKSVIVNPVRQAQAYFYMNYVFNAGDSVGIHMMLYAYVMAVLNDRRWLGNRGVWSILGRTVLGSK